MQYKVSVSYGKNGRGKKKISVLEVGDNGYTTSRTICDAVSEEWANKISTALTEINRPTDNYFEE